MKRARDFFFIKTNKQASNKKKNTKKMVSLKIWGKSTC